MLVIMQAAPPARGIFWSTLVIILLLIHVTITEEISENQDDKDSSRQYEQFIKEEVDLDQDGMVSKKEIIHKMEKMFSHQRQSEVDQLINKYDIDYDGKISWKEFVYTAYPDETLRNTEDLDYDKKKFDMADANHDRVLDSKEFSSFYFPGTGNENTVEMVMNDWLAKVDLNRDNFVTMDEFLASQSEGNPDIHDQRKLREHFTDDYDINKDGKLDKDELKEWLVPTRASAMRGTRKMLKLADNDGDGHLSMEEIIENDRSLQPLLQDANSFRDEL